MYAILNWYDGMESVDVTTITHATENDLQLSGQCKSGCEFFADIYCCENIADAFDKSMHWPTDIYYGQDFSDDEKMEIVRVTNRLIKDAEYRTRYHKTADDVPSEFTMDDIKYVNY